MQVMSLAEIVPCGRGNDIRGMACDEGGARPTLGHRQGPSRGRLRQGPCPLSWTMGASSLRTPRHHTATRVNQILMSKPHSQ